jgi:hypothetical protein
MEQCVSTFAQNGIDGPLLLSLTEADLRRKPLELKSLADIRKVCTALRSLKSTRALSSIYPPEPWLASFSRLIFSFAYLALVAFITAFTMTVAHVRLPDTKSYPPLPDIFLDNVPLIPWAMLMSEFMICSGLLILFVIILLHKRRMIVLRRFNVICGTLFLFRSLTMVVTSLAVPGSHLECEKLPIETDNLEAVLAHVWSITKGGGMTMNGVRTCGDYMFSGHTLVLTLCNLTIVEYSPKKWRGLHIITWAGNFFGMFFILAAHEHYTIDVVMAYYITSRLFDYYHTVAITSSILNKTSPKVVKKNGFQYFVFSYMEEDLQGPVVNQYEMPWTALSHLFTVLKHIIVGNTVTKS